MALKILRREIATQYSQTVPFPRGAEILGAAVADGVVSVWYRADDSEPPVDRYLYLAAEGDPADLLEDLPAWGPFQVGAQTLLLLDDGEPE